MPSIIDPTDDPVKLMFIGDQGEGKSGGTVAPLLAAGYNVRVLDPDNGRKIVRTLLTNDHFPYASWMKSKGLDKDLRNRASYIPVATPMTFKTVTVRNQDPITKQVRTTSEKLLMPQNGRAWEAIIGQLERWKDPDLGVDFGHVSTWDTNTVLVLDSWTQISRQAYYNVQELNGRLGQREEGRTHQRDIGTAQSQLRRFLEMIFDPSIRCHVVVICHIQRLDDSRGFAQTPEEVHMSDPSAIIQVKGYPKSVGIQLSRQMGSYFNDSLVIEQTGAGRNTKRVIRTIPTIIDGVRVGTKSSVYLNPEYDISTGMAEIFAAERYQPPPTEMLDYFRNWKTKARSQDPAQAAAQRPPLNTGVSKLQEVKM